MPFALKGTCLLARVGSPSLGNVILIDSVCHCGRWTMAMCSRRLKSTRQVVQSGDCWLASTSCCRWHGVRSDVDGSFRPGTAEEEDVPIAGERLETRRMACVCISIYRAGLGLQLLRASSSSGVPLGNVRLPCPCCQKHGLCLWGPLKGLGTGGGVVDEGRG